MAIVTLSDYLLQRAKADNGRLIRDRLLVGFCARLYKRRRSFMVSTSCCGKQVRVTIGFYPLMKTEEARVIATEIIKRCRAGTYLKNDIQSTKTYKSIREILPQYIMDKGLKQSSLGRYDSVMRTHFSEWYDRPVNELSLPEFAEHCHLFVRTQTVRFYASTNVL